ncbi:MAG: DUF1559 domain-containing protein [Gemmataceae bacterium]|nr:DUF1559 domain-containing protein [Gemmataceae bacterium]
MRRAAYSPIEVVVVMAIMGIVAGLTLAGVQRVRAAAARTQCLNHLRQLGLAAHGYHDAHSRLPPGVTLPGEADPYPFMGWHTRLLPHLEQQVVWDEAVAAFRTSRDFTADPPHPGSGLAVGVFGCPTDPRTSAPQVVAGTLVRGLTSYLGVAGRRARFRDGVLFAGSTVRLTDITDGASNTLLAGERPPGPDMVLGWWYAGWGQDQDGDADMLLGVRARNTGAYAPGCRAGPYHFGPGEFNNPCAVFHFWSPHPGGAHFAFADGAVRFLGYSADDILPALATRAGGEAVALPD